MAADIDSNRQSGYMSRVCFNRNGERGRLSSETLRADSQSVYFRQNLFFHISIEFVAVRHADGPAERFFREQSAFFEISADADTQNNGWTGIAAGCLYRFNNKINNIIKL